MGTLKKQLFNIVMTVGLFSAVQPYLYSQSIENSFMKKAAILVSNTADKYVPPSMKIGDPEKYYWPKAMARFVKYGIKDTLANGWIEAMKNNSPFHFTLVGMARLMMLYPDASAIKQNKELILYKVFQREDVHNAWTSEGTENHINMARTSGYIFAQEALNYPNLFPDAKVKLKMMEDWLLEWSKKLYQYGPGEWNSSIYYAYDIIGWLNIYDFAKNQRIKDAAKAVLDYYASEIALHYSWGTTGGAEMRGTGANNINYGATNYLAWLWYGKPEDRDPYNAQGSQFIQCLHAITSSYRPPVLAVKLAQKSFNSPADYIESKPSYLFENPSYMKGFFHVEKSFTLGSCINAYGGFTGASSQIVMWRLIVKTDSSFIPYEIGGNGCFHDNWTGVSRDPWTQQVQYKNVLVQLTRTPENAGEIVIRIKKMLDQWHLDWRKSLIQRFPSESDSEHRIIHFADGNILNKSFITMPEVQGSFFKDNIFIINLGNVYLSIYFIAKEKVALPFTPAGQRGRMAIQDEAPAGKVCGFVLEATEANNYQSFDHYQQQVLKETSLDKSLLNSKQTIHYKSLAGDIIEATYVDEGTFTEAIFDWGYGPTKATSMKTGFRQPEWPIGKGFGRIPKAIVNGKLIDFSGIWPVFSGANLTMEKGALKLKNNTSYYEVDYTGNCPKFKKSEDI